MAWFRARFLAMAQNLRYFIFLRTDDCTITKKKPARNTKYLRKKMICGEGKNIPNLNRTDTDNKGHHKKEPNKNKTVSREISKKIKQFRKRKVVLTYTRSSSPK